jgi:hypothetical protein
MEDENGRLSLVSVKSFRCHRKSRNAIFHSFKYSKTANLEFKKPYIGPAKE